MPVVVIVVLVVTALVLLLIVVGPSRRIRREGPIAERDYYALMTGEAPEERDEDDGDDPEPRA